LHCALRFAFASQAWSTAAHHSHASNLPQLPQSFPKVRGALEGASLDAGLVLQVEEAYSELMQENAGAESRRVAATIKPVAHERMTEILHVSTNLMSAKGHHAAVHQSVPFAKIWGLILGQCFPNCCRSEPAGINPHTLCLTEGARVNRGSALTTLSGKGAMHESNVVLQQTLLNLLLAMLEALQCLAHKNWS
jgi:hypothetical protein